MFDFNLPFICLSGYFLLRQYTIKKNQMYQTEVRIFKIAIYRYFKQFLFLLSCRYHIELVKLLACCTMGKNVFTEIKCHSLLPLDDVVKMVCHKDTIPEVKDALVNFLTHCYIDTEVEMKEIYTSNHMWQLFEKSFLIDMGVVSNATHDRKHADTVMENYVTMTLMDIINTFFKSPFSEQSTTIQVSPIQF